MPKPTANTLLKLLSAYVVAAFLCGGANAARAETLRLAFSSFSATNAAFFTAIEEKLFERRGIDLTHVYIASSTVVLPAVLTREVDFATLSGETVARAGIALGNCNGDELPAAAAKRSRPARLFDRGQGRQRA